MAALIATQRRDRLRFDYGLTLGVVAVLLVATMTMASASAQAKGPKMTDMIVFFTANAQRVGAIRPDGSNERYPEFGLAGQPLRMGKVSADGKQAELLNLRDSKTWRYDFIDKSLQEIKLPTFEALPGGKLYLHTENVADVYTVFTTDAAGANRENVYSSPGFGYGLGLSPDGGKLAYHITGTPGKNPYEIYVLDLKSGKNQLIISDPKYIHFGPEWSKDGKWLLYQRCAYQQDPGHDRSDVCISRADGSEQRVLTTGQSHWFAAAYGTPQQHSSGSNRPVWSPDCSKIACALLLPDSRTAWPWAKDRPDTDHFNRDYHPEQANGGTRICVIDVGTGKITTILQDPTPTWNLRLAWSPDGKQIAFVRADVGCLGELWIIDADGGNKRFLTHGYRGTGVDFPTWEKFAVPSL
jgi:Tol biopolymer transport system component